MKPRKPKKERRVKKDRRHVLVPQGVVEQAQKAIANLYRSMKQKMK